MSNINCTINPLQLPLVEGAGSFRAFFNLKDGSSSTVNNSTTFVNATRLEVPFGPLRKSVSATWNIFYGCTATGNIKFRVVTSNGQQAGFYGAIRINPAGVLEQTAFTVNTGEIPAIGLSPASGFIQICATLITTQDVEAIANLQFTQVTAEVSNCNVQTGSFVIANQIPYSLT